MKHFIQDNTYVIVDEKENIIFQLTLTHDLPNNQIIIRTKDEVYAGPIDFLHFKEE